MVQLTPFADGMSKVQCRAGAKVPIVKMWDPELQLACDLNVNNPLALENTRMIKTYVQIDERVRPLAKIIKYWTKRRILNDAGARPPLPWLAKGLYANTFSQPLEALSVPTHGYA
jgi:DNA polymerase sigma